MGVDLSVDFLGFRLKNPLMLTEGPLSGDLQLIERASDYDIGLIFTKGIRPKRAVSPMPYMSRYGRSLINADWSDIGLEEWLKVIERLDSSIPLVTSIAKNYVRVDDAVDMAELLVKAGSRIISFVDYVPAELVKTVRLAKKRLKVPVMVKLPPFIRNLEEVVGQLVEAGVDAIAAMDSIGPVLSVDTTTGLPVMGSEDGSGYLSGRYILPVTLKYVYDISHYTDLPVVGVGGVSDSDSALQMIMVGATGVGMVSEPLLKGLRVFNSVARGIESFLSLNGYSSVTEIRGVTRKKLKTRKPITGMVAYIDTNLCNLCGLCEIVCYAKAIHRRNDSYSVDDLSCTGCGLCMSVCNRGAITYVAK